LTLQAAWMADNKKPNSLQASMAKAKAGRTATDIALLQPPMALWGYNMQATDEALDRIAASIRDRDVRIVALEQLVTDLSREPSAQPLSSPYMTARHRRAQFEPAPPPPEQSHD